MSQFSSSFKLNVVVVVAFELFQSPQQYWHCSKKPVSSYLQIIAVQLSEHMGANNGRHFWLFWGVFFVQNHFVYTATAPKSE